MNPNASIQVSVNLFQHSAFAWISEGKKRIHHLFKKIKILNTWTKTTAKMYSELIYLTATWSNEMKTFLDLESKDLVFVCH